MEESGALRDFALQDAFGWYLQCDCCQRTARVSSTQKQRMIVSRLPSEWKVCDTEGGGQTLLCPDCTEGCKEEDDTTGET
jgi:hypothetical protein